MSNVVWTVSTLVNRLKQTIEQNVAFKSFYLKGEISNFTSHSSGHWYFSLKDEGARVSCVMFSSYANAVDFKPKNGDKVLLRAALGVYAMQGQVQCSVFSMRNDGLGDLYLQFELLKKKLFEAGLFSDERKKPIPSYPKSIGIITGRETAALQDMLKTMTLRWPIVEVTIYPSLVQGDQAPRNIIEQLIKADRNQHNVLILARGGGSIEDLWAFNNEQLAYTIEALKTPLITGVGHETDTTIADLVADLRAATPTAAVQLAVPDIQEVEQSVHNQLKRLNQIIDSELNKQRVALRQVQTHPVFTQPHRLMMSHQLQLSNYEQQLSQQTKRAHRLRVGLSTQQSQLSQRILSFTNNQTVRLARSQDLLIKRIEQKTLNSQNAFGQTLKLLNAFSPLNSLARGYSIVSQEDKVIRLINDIDYDREMKIRLFDGTVRAKAIKEQSDE